MVAPTAGAYPPADLASLAARFGAVLRAEGLPAGPERCARFARAIQVAAPATVRQLYWCALATLIADPAHVPIFDRAFAATFHADHELAAMIGTRTGTQPHDRSGAGRGGDEAAGQAGRTDVTAGERGALAAATERLTYRDFAELTEAELAELAAAMRRLRLVLPPRRSRRTVTGSRGDSVDLRATLRRAGRAAGHPVRLYRRRPRYRPRRLVVLCDISGSMAAYARAMLQLLYCASGGAGSEVFTFATQLTRLTRVLRRAAPSAALARAGQAAPDWSGGTRIGAAVREFIDGYGARGLARGAVVVIISDGWDTGPPAELGRQMSRLARLAYRIVWVNPRTASPRYRPLAGGMAAAWPYCDAVVSGHRLAALTDLLAALNPRSGAHPPPKAGATSPRGRD